MTRIQSMTLVLLIGYLIWEISVWFWKQSLPESDPVIRVDLIFIYPLLVTFIIISIYQYFKHSNLSS